MKNIIIISGPSGSGKDVIIQKIQSLLPIEFIITSTTRAQRPGESEGHPHYFLSKEEFQKGITEKQFIEYSTNENSEYYGVTDRELTRATTQGKLALWRVDWKGVINIKKMYPHIPAIYISAPITVLEARLRARDKGKSEDYFTERMNYTREWLKHLDIYDYIVENEEGKLDETIEKVRVIIEKYR